MLFTWYSYDPDVDGDSSGIAARIGTAQGDGSIAWDSTGEFTVNAEVQSTQAFPQVTQLSDGQVLFTWTSADPDVDGDNYGIAARVLDIPAPVVSDNTSYFEELAVNTEVQSAQAFSQVTQLSDGRVLFTWYSDDPDVDGNGSGIAARIGTVQGDGSIAWDSAGEFTVNTEVQSDQTESQVTQLSDGRVLFTWTSADPDVDGDNYGIAARIGTVQGDGSIAWDSAGEFTVNTEVQSNQTDSQVTQLSDGRVLFTWRSWDPDVDGDSSGIAARTGTVQSDGSIAWDSAGEFTVNTEVQSTQAFPQVTQLSDGRVLFTWTSSDFDVDGIEARIGTVQSDGSIAWLSAGEITDVGVRGSLSNPQVTQLSDGRVLFTWQSSDPDVDGDSSGIAARIGTVQGNGSIAWGSAGTITVNTEVQSTQDTPQVTQLSDGRVLFTWYSYDPDVDGDSSGIAARIGRRRAMAVSPGIAPASSPSMRRCRVHKLFRKSRS